MTSHDPPLNRAWRCRRPSSDTPTLHPTSTWSTTTACLLLLAWLGAWHTGVTAYAQQQQHQDLPLPAQHHVMAQATSRITTIVPSTNFKSGTVANGCSLQNETRKGSDRYMLSRKDGTIITQDIILETSSRVTHQLSTTIFKIFLEEVLNYKRVIIEEKPNDFDNRETIGRMEFENIDVFPATTINVEVWTPPESDNMELVDECGKVANPGRIGWFVPVQLSSGLKMALQKHVGPSDTLDAIVHWQLFQDKDFVRIFEITDERHLGLIREKSRDRTKQYYCRNTNCTDGMYVPSVCRTNRCATLLAPDYTSTEFSIEHIETLKLLVQVVWLGPNLADVSRTLQADYLQRQKVASKSYKGSSLLILSWTPSEVIPRANEYLRVTFPSCEITGDDTKLGCKYELSRLLKFAWIDLKTYGKLAYNALKAYKFTDEEYIDLLDMYNNSTTKSIPEIACNWFRDNAAIWKSWKLSLNLKVKGIVWIGGIFPLHGDTYTGQDILRGASLARAAINTNSNILENYELRLQILNGKCKADKVMQAYITYVTLTESDSEDSSDAISYKNMIGILGPACSDTVEPLIGISKHFETIVISYSAEASGLSDRTKYPYFFRTIGDNKQYKHVYRSMFSKLGWHRFGALTEDGQKYTEYISQMNGYLEEEGISLIENVKFPRERNTFEMSRYLQDLNQKRARIIIADIIDDVARTVMCEAYKLNMIGKYGYVWFLPSWLNSTWYNTTYYNYYNNETVNCTTDNMIEAINGYFSITHANYANDNDTMQENRTVGQWREDFNKKGNLTNIRSNQQANYAGYAYDAVWTYAYALDKLIKKYPTAISTLHSHNTTAKFVQYVQDTDFHGVSGHIKFYGGASRFSDIHVIQWYNREARVVGTFTPNISANNPEQHGGDLVLHEGSIVWLSATGKPDDGTQPPQVCALEWLANFLKTECEDTIIILNVVLGTVVLFLAMFGVYIVHKQYHRKMADSRKIMEHLGINFDMRRMDLDKWEIPRERIVINRKLGEGAFGAVYGGEVDMAEKGWVMVAVKTLKEGSAAEEKLDFLSEAEVMKRFDHNNIVKLLGVCMKAEPVYTVMEFMLYGDLKTFLLARRNLVNDKNSEETEEISSKKLTNMALDVARALGYLAELKFVHRDIASRNCLISKTRSVKLGDFGMTRLMYENDYYRFNRKGMLPVRWMAPESLALGVFTPQSDVWSYGVLLYEIVTFGSFPFQGMTNNQVLEHVKEGNMLKIPSGIKVQLESLMKLCWNQDYKKRPSASEIVEYLANNPRLITPCLEGPTASVQIENTGQMEIQLPESQFRKCSSTLSTKHIQNLANGSIPQASRSYESSPAKQSASPLANSPPHRVHSSSPLHTIEDPNSSPTGYGIMLNDLNRPLDIDYCPKEPLLGSGTANNSSRSSSLLALAKFVTGGGSSTRDGGGGGAMMADTNRIGEQRSVDIVRRGDDSDESDSDSPDDYMNVVPNGQVVTHA